MYRALVAGSPPSSATGSVVARLAREDKAAQADAGQPGCTKLAQIELVTRQERSRPGEKMRLRSPAVAVVAAARRRIRPLRRCLTLVPGEGGSRTMRATRAVPRTSGHHRHAYRVAPAVARPGRSHDRDVRVPQARRGQKSTDRATGTSGDARIFRRGGPPWYSTWVKRPRRSTRICRNPGSGTGRLGRARDAERAQTCPETRSSAISRPSADFYRSLDDFKVFGAGWTNRTKQMLEAR